MGRSRAANADDNHFFALLADAVDQGNEIAVTGGQHELGDVRVGEQRLHRVDAEVHVNAILDRAASAAQLAVIIIGRHVHRLDAVGVERACDAGVAVPVGVGSGDDDAAEVFAPVHDHFKIRVRVQFVANADVHILKVDKNGDIRSLGVIWHWLFVSLLSGETAEVCHAFGKPGQTKPDRVWQGGQYGYLRRRRRTILMGESKPGGRQQAEALWHQNHAWCCAACLWQTDQGIRCQCTFLHILGNVASCPHRHVCSEAPLRLTIALDYGMCNCAEAFSGGAALVHGVANPPCG